MAEAKRTIVMYSDWESIFNQLEDHEAGILIKHFFSYVNDKNPVLEDRLLKMAFEPMKLQLKRDLIKWEETKQKRSEAGRKGGIKSGEVRSAEANEANASKEQQDEANEADNVNGNVSVNGNVIKKVSTDKSAVGDCDNFVKAFNSLANRDFRSTKKVKSSYNARIKDKYTKEQIWLASKNAHKDKIHIENSFTHLTPEYILREDILNKYINYKNGTSAQSQMTYEPNSNRIDHSNLED